MTLLSGIFAPALCDTSVDSHFLAKRHRLEFRFRYGNSGQLQVDSIQSLSRENTNVENIMGAFSYDYWVKEELAAHVTFSGLLAESSSVEDRTGVTDLTVVLSAVLFGVRYYPVSGPQTPLPPYLSVGIGPYLGVESRQSVGRRVIESTRVLGTFGGQLGGGLDIPLGRDFMMGVNVAYNMMADFPDPLAGQVNYSGVEASAGISVLFGRGI